MAGSRNLTLAAASSNARGSPSRRQQMEATAAAFSEVRSKAGAAARARSAKRRPEGEPATSAAEGERVEAGSLSGPTGYSCSPRTRSGARLVARTESSGQDSIRSATSGAAPSRCSRLSSTSRNRFSFKKAWSASSGVRFSASLSPRTRATIGRTSAGSSRGARATKVTPSGKRPVTSLAARRARRVLPTPPVPVSVSSLEPGLPRKPPISASSDSLPRSGVGGTGSAGSGTAARAVDGVPRLCTEARSERRSSSGRPSASPSDLTVCG